MLQGVHLRSQRVAAFVLGQPDARLYSSAPAIGISIGESFRSRLRLGLAQLALRVAHTWAGVAPDWNSGGRIDGRHGIGLDRRMAKQDPAAILQEILGEADALIRRRLEEQGLEVPHLVVAVTPDVLRSFGEDLKNVADELTEPPEPGNMTH